MHSDWFCCFYVLQEDALRVSFMEKDSNQFSLGGDELFMKGR